MARPIRLRSVKAVVGASVLPAALTIIGLIWLPQDTQSKVILTIALCVIVVLSLLAVLERPRYCYIFVDGIKATEAGAMSLWIFAEAGFVCVDFKVSPWSSTPAMHDANYRDGGPSGRLSPLAPGYTALGGSNRLMVHDWRVQFWTSEDAWTERLTITGDPDGVVRQTIQLVPSRGKPFYVNGPTLPFMLP